MALGMEERTIKSIDRNVLRRIVRMAGRFARPARPQMRLEECHRVLLIRPGGIGDAALMLPLLRRLRIAGATVDVFCMARNRGIFELFRSHGYVQEIYLMERLADVFSARAQRYDCVFDSEQWFYGSGVLASLMHRGAIIGFDTNERRNLYDSFVHYSQEDYEAQSFLNLLEPLGVRAELSLADLRLEPTAGPASIPQGRLIALALGASVPSRLVPEATGRDLVRRISSAFDQVVLIGSPVDRQWSGHLKDAAANVVDACGTTTLAQTVGLLQKCDGFAGTDSGPLHLAVLAGVRHIVGIFGPGIHQKWGHPGLIRVVRRNDLPCSPCAYGRFSQVPPCPYGYTCIGGLPAERIAAAVLGKMGAEGVEGKRKP